MVDFAEDAERSRTDSATTETEASMVAEAPALRRADSEPRATAPAATRPEQAAELIASLAAAAEPGDRLGTKDELRARCGVSVGTFNEALRLVQSPGVVTVRPGPGGGLFASRQSPWSGSATRCWPWTRTPHRSPTRSASATRSTRCSLRTPSGTPGART